MRGGDAEGEGGSMTSTTLEGRSCQTIALKGYIYNCQREDKREAVEGFAFEVPGFDWLHLWVTPSIDGFRPGWLVSHWESGAALMDQAVTNVEEAMQLAIEMVYERGEQKTREAIANWFSGKSWPGK